MSHERNFSPARPMNTEAQSPNPEVVESSQKRVLTYHGRRTNPRAEYRLRRNELVNSSLTMQQKFPALKKLAIDIEYFDAGGITRTGAMTCKPNLLHAKSILCFNCTQPECVGGDFDLTNELAQAVSTGQKSVQGEMRCQGTQHKNRKDPGPCQSILRYKLSLSY